MTASANSPIKKAMEGVEDTLLEREQVIASFSKINWDSYGRTMLDADEVSHL